MTLLLRSENEAARSNPLLESVLRPGATHATHRLDVQPFPRQAQRGTFYLANRL